MNRERLLELADFIEKNPERYDQRTLLNVDSPSGFGERSAFLTWWADGRPSGSKPICGTCGCLAGNAVLLFGNDPNFDATRLARIIASSSRNYGYLTTGLFWLAAAQILLDLTGGESIVLFHDQADTQLWDGQSAAEVLRKFVAEGHLQELDNLEEEHELFNSDYGPIVARYSGREETPVHSTSTGPFAEELRIC